MRTLGVYYRVSTKTQDLESQKTVVQRYLDALPFQFAIKEFSDEGISGTEDNRPGFQDLLQAAREKEIDTVVVYALDRFSRTSNTAMRTILELEDIGCAFVSVTQPVLNLGHEIPFRKTILTAFAEIAQLEREMIVVRIRDGVAASIKAKGNWGPWQRRTYTDEQMDTIKYLRAQGMGWKAIGTQMGISGKTLWRMAKRLGWDTGPYDPDRKRK